MARISEQAGRRLGAGLLALACLAGVTLWQAFDDNDQSSRSPASSDDRTRPDDRAPASSSAPMVQRPSRLQTEHFSLLRTPPESLPPTVTALLRNPTDGLNWRLAQRMPTTAGISFWVVPGNDVLCVVSQEQTSSVATACSTTRDAIARGLAAVLLREASRRERRPAHRLVVGIAPDGARKIRVRTHDKTTTAPVIDGAFALRDTVMDPPDRIALG